MLFVFSFQISWNKDQYIVIVMYYAVSIKIHKHQPNDLWQSITDP